MAAYRLLQQHAMTNKEKMAAIGYCFGGGIVLEMARRGVELDGVASFHGSLGTGAPASPGKVKAKVLVLNGADDPFVKAESIQAFKSEMKAARVDYEFIDYPGAKHAFTNPEADKNGKKFNMPLAYNKEADRKSWQKMQQFFDSILYFIRFEFSSHEAFNRKDGPFRVRYRLSLCDLSDQPFSLVCKRDYRRSSPVAFLVGDYYSLSPLNDSDG